MNLKIIPLFVSILAGTSAQVCTDMTRCASIAGEKKKNFRIDNCRQGCYEYENFLSFCPDPSQTFVPPVPELSCPDLSHLPPLCTDHEKCKALATKAGKLFKYLTGWRQGCYASYYYNVVYYYPESSEQESINHAEELSCPELSNTPSTGPSAVPSSNPSAGPSMERSSFPSLGPSSNPSSTDSMCKQSRKRVRRAYRKYRKNTPSLTTLLAGIEENGCSNPSVNPSDTPSISSLCKKLRKGMRKAYRKYRKITPSLTTLLAVIEENGCEKGKKVIDKKIESFMKSIEEFNEISTDATTMEISEDTTNDDDDDDEDEDE